MKLKHLYVAVAAALAAPIERYLERTGLVLYAVANTKSTQVSNADAAPPVINNMRSVDGRLQESVATVEVAAADDDTSVYRMHRVRSTDRISSIEVANDAITGGVDYNLGVHDVAANGGAAVSENLFGDALDLSSASAGFVDRTYETTPTNIANVGKMLWELLGLSADPGKEYDITLTGITVGTAAGTISTRLRFVRGN
jgi:hypothetical protein